VAGAPLAFHPAYTRYGALCRIALAAGIGAVVVSLLMTLAALVPIAWGIGWLLAASLVVSSLLRLALGREAEGPLATEGGTRPTVLLAAALSAASVAAALFATFAAAASSTDLFRFWGPKAEAFAAARTIDAVFLRAPWLEHLHADYPPLVTNLFAFATLAAGRFPWGAAMYTFPIFLAALAVALPGILAADRLEGQSKAVAALAVAVASLLGIVFLVAGIGDTVLLFYEACAMALLTGPDAGRGSRLLLAGLFLAGATSAKVEGLPFTLAVAALVPLLSPRQRTLRAGLLLLGPTAICLGAWLAFGWTRQLFRFYFGYGRFDEVHMQNLPIVLRAIGSELALHVWGLPFLVPLAVLLFSRAVSRMVWLPLGTASLLTAFLVFTYLHTPQMVREWITWSAGRIFTPVAVLLALAPLARAGPDEGRERGK